MYYLIQTQMKTYVADKVGLGLFLHRFYPEFITDDMTDDVQKYIDTIDKASEGNTTVSELVLTEPLMEI